MKMMLQDLKHTQAADGAGEGGACPSSLIAVHKLSTPDRLYDLQLARDVTIVNERTQREQGALPPDGLPVIPKRKPATWRPEAPIMATHQEHVKEETMKLSQMAMAAALGVATLTSPSTYGSEVAISASDAHPVQAHEPVWPNNGIAERELGDDEGTLPENMFVEHMNGQWHVWVILSPAHGQAKAMDFFNGQVENITVKNPGGFNDSFVDAHGRTHRSVVHPAFDFKDPRPGGALGDDSGVVQFNRSQLVLGGDPKFAPLYLDVTRRVAKDFETVVWQKIPLYKKDGEWSSFIGTALDLRDGTMLMVAGNYIFRVRLADLASVGEAPHLHVVDAVSVEQVVDRAKGKEIKDTNAYLTEKLNLE